MQAEMFPPPAVAGFDYAALPIDEASELRNIADDIRAKQKRIGRAVFDTGNNLASAKETLGHGKFGAWLSAEFGWSERTAQRYMQAAEVFWNKTDIVSDLPATTIYQLSAPSTPEPVRVAVVERLEKGEHVTHDEIKSMIRKGKAEAHAAREDEKRTPEQRAKRQKAEDRRKRDLERSRAEREAELNREISARREAAALIVERVGNDVGRLLELLDAARFIYASDIRDITNPSFLTARLQALRA